MFESTTYSTCALGVNFTPVMRTTELLCTSAAFVSFAGKFSLPSIIILIPFFVLARSFVLRH